jgi:hypothetical protein
MVIKIFGGAKLQAEDGADSRHCGTWIWLAFGGSLWRFHCSKVCNTPLPMSRRSGCCGCNMDFQLMTAPVFITLFKWGSFLVIEI